MRVWGPRPPWWLVRVSVVPCICVCVHPFPADDVYRCVGLQRACRCTEGGGHGAVRDGGRGAAVGQAWGICPAPPSAEVLRFLTDFASWPLNIQLGTLAASPAQLPGVYRCSSWTSPAGAPASAHSGRPVAELRNAERGVSSNVHRSDGSSPRGRRRGRRAPRARAGPAGAYRKHGPARREGGVCVSPRPFDRSLAVTCVYILRELYMRCGAFHLSGCGAASGPGLSTVCLQWLSKHQGSCTPKAPSRPCGRPGSGSRIAAEPGNVPPVARDWCAAAGGSRRAGRRRAKKKLEGARWTPRGCTGCHRRFLIRFSV